MPLSRARSGPPFHRSNGNSGTETLLERHESAAYAFEPERVIRNASSLVSIVSPPSEAERPSIPPAEPRAPLYHPFSPHVIFTLMFPSILGLLARLGLLSITTYDGRAIFPLAWVQAAGCLIMGFALGLKEPIGELYVSPCGNDFSCIANSLGITLVTVLSIQL